MSKFVVVVNVEADVCGSAYTTPSSDKGVVLLLGKSVRLVKMLEPSLSLGGFCLGVLSLDGSPLGLITVGVVHGVFDAPGSKLGIGGVTGTVVTGPA